MRPGDAVQGGTPVVHIVCAVRKVWTYGPKQYSRICAPHSLWPTEGGASNKPVTCFFCLSNMRLT